MKLGILSCEFFDHELGGVGGFGWAARAVGRLLVERPESGIEPVYLSGRNLPARPHGVDGIPFLARSAGTAALVRALRSVSPDMILSVDYDRAYWPVLAALPRTPLLMWSRDPRDPTAWSVIDRLRLPDGDPHRPAGLVHTPGDTMRLFGALARVLRRPLRFASPAPGLAQRRARSVFGLDPGEIELLPNPVAPPTREHERAAEPTVAFLGRLDPIKRPWLAVDLARRMPDVRFLIAGRAHHSGPGAWTAERLPPNVEMLGHVDGVAKEALLGTAWVLLNTSIHEGLAISFLEALTVGTPVVAAVDPEAVVSRFGVLAAHADGDGTAALDSYEEALRGLLDDSGRRRALGEAGRAWVTSTHTPERFVSALRRGAAALGVS